MRFRKKPVTIEAFRLGYDDVPEWCMGACSIQGTDTMQIATLEGVMIANKGDYIIKGVKGEVYPCKADIFAETYDEVEGGDRDGLR